MSSRYLLFLDLDKTLLRVNSGKVLAREAYKSGIMRRADLMRGAVLSLLHKYDVMDNLKIIHKMAWWLKGMEEEKLSKLSSKICNNFLFSEIHNEAWDLIDFHKSRNSEVVILSAALKYICSPIAEKLAVDHVLCSEMEIESGKFTGKPIGEFCYGEGKLRRLERFCREEGVDPGLSYFYTDSFSDLPALKAVGHPVCVNPDKKLKKAAIRSGWKIVNWR